MRVHLTLVLLFYTCVSSTCERVLVVFPMPSPSHNILGTALAKGLASGGLDVTYVSPFDIKGTPKNLKVVKLDGVMEWFADDLKNQEVDLYSLEDKHPLINVLVLNSIGQKLGELFFNNTAVQKLFKSNEQYDAVIIEQFCNDAMKILAYHFKAPLIMFSTVGTNKWVNSLVGNPEPPSYVPDLFMSFKGNNPSFSERLHNFIFGLISQGNQDLYFIPEQEKILKQFYPNPPDLSQLQLNVSLLLVNSHESINQPVPRVPNIIDIGGFHVSPPKPLKNDLQTFMDNANEGVIYFSMGSNLIPSKMPNSTKNAILATLGSRKEKILWKWDENNLMNKPANVKIEKWFPQQDILAHPNCKLFITHGGLLSTTEAVYHGVPVLAFPIFGDQKSNAARVETLGFGKFLPFSQVNEVNLKLILDELLENPKYKENAKYRSKIMHDRPVAPMDLAVYWVKYVIRHKGARHLRVTGADLAYYKYFMLDVFAALLIATFVGLYLVCKVIKAYFHRDYKGKYKQS